MLTIWSPKGGSGASVTAAALAITLSRRGGCRLVDLRGDQPAVLGLAGDPPTGVGDWLAASPDAPASALDRLAVDVAPGLTLVGCGAGSLHGVEGPAGGELAAALAGEVPTVVDLGGGGDPWSVEIAAASRTVVAVVRPCYLALRRAVRHPVLEPTTAVVVVDEVGRSLRTDDVARVLDRPVAHVIRADARVARAVDAGTLATRLPDGLRRMADAVLTFIESSTGRAV